jgi:phosphoribosylformimino-5-aminoimidazole carboxamide ribotide isomerase
MIVIPAIDIKNGLCVRLRQGKMDEETVYSKDPVGMALRWQREGARLIHVVDLDAAITGVAKNFEVIREISAAIKTPLEIGGGIRDFETALRYLSLANVERIVVSTAALENPELIEKINSRYPAGTAVSIDAKDGMVAVKGWTSLTDVSAIELARTLDARVAAIVYTDISRDGMLAGPNIEATKKLIEAVRIPVIASGGVARTEDIAALKKIGAYGAIVGRALYTGALDLKRAQEIC